MGNIQSTFILLDIKEKCHLMTLIPLTSLEQGKKQVQFFFLKTSQDLKIMLWWPLFCFAIKHKKRYQFSFMY